MNEEFFTRGIGKSIPSLLLAGAILCSVPAETINAQPPARDTLGQTVSAPHFKWLGWGEVKPEGWIRQQMLRDLKGGFAGHLNELCQEANSDIFVSGRNGVQKANTNNAVHCCWWNGETEGNWRTGFILMAYLSGDPDTMAKADAFVAHVLATQDKDGYLGINAPEFRYKTTGELWTQTCLLRGLLDYAELTGRKDVLTAVERAAHHTIAVLTQAGTFQWGDPHDLMFCDVLERLFDLTGDRSYPDFGLWLYSSYSKACPHDDIALPALLDISGGLLGHGAHTYEHLRVPLWLWSVTGRKDLETAWRNGVEKINRYTYPGGAAVAQEGIADCLPDPTFTEFEYCAAKELQWSMESALEKTGETRFADRTELLWLNDEQAGRLADGTALTYLTNENRLQLDGKTPNGLFSEPRNTYSPTQRRVAVCCPPNATQVAALYVHGMWMRQANGDLAALLYGPCTVLADVNGVPVHITEATAYPFSNSVLIRVQPDRPVDMTFLLRIPGWSHDTSVTCEGADIASDGMYWRVRKNWKPGYGANQLYSDGPDGHGGQWRGGTAIRGAALRKAHPFEREGRRRLSAEGIQRPVLRANRKTRKPPGLSASGKVGSTRPPILNPVLSQTRSNRSVRLHSRHSRQCQSKREPTYWSHSIRP